jgi:hypothetical protein
MKRILSILPLIMILLSACAAPGVGTTPVTVETNVPANMEVVPASTDVPADAPAEALPDAPPDVPSMPSMKLPAPSFEAQLYLDEKSGFALDYPNGWTVSEPMFSERARQVQLLSSPDLANAATLPEGATRLSATVYDWEPKNNLAAAVAEWKTSWEASGFMILEEEELVLEQGLPAMQFTVQTPDAVVVHLIVTLGDRYLMLSGEGNLELVKEIVQRVRPISVK